MFYFTVFALPESASSQTYAANPAVCRYTRELHPIPGGRKIPVNNFGDSIIFLLLQL